MVNIFSIGYMKGEPRYYWFFAVLQLFVASMLMLVMADNLLLLYISWELVGVCSFLLIGFYWEKRSATEAAKKAFITTRIGDVGLLIGIILLWTGDRHVQHPGNHARCPERRNRQYLPLHQHDVRLPRGHGQERPGALPRLAAGRDGRPDPVSALIHAATMVVAGVYLDGAPAPDFREADGTMLIITIVGLTTALLTGFMALAQTDIKKVLAYSTVGQLGFMFVALGSGDHDCGDVPPDDARLLQGAPLPRQRLGHPRDAPQPGDGQARRALEEDADHRHHLPHRLAGARRPRAARRLLEQGRNPARHTDLEGGWALVLLGFAAVMTAFYTTRLFIRTFLGEPQDEHVYEHTHESSWVMTGPLIFLAILAALAGFLVFHGVGKALGFPGGITEFVFLEEPERYHIDWGLAGGSIVIAVVGIFAGAWLYWGGSIKKSTQLANLQPGLYDMLKNKFYFDELYQ